MPFLSGLIARQLGAVLDGLGSSTGAFCSSLRRDLLLGRRGHWGEDGEGDEGGAERGLDHGSPFPRPRPRLYAPGVHSRVHPCERQLQPASHRGEAAVVAGRAGDGPGRAAFDRARRRRIAAAAVDGRRRHRFELTSALFSTTAVEPSSWRYSAKGRQLAARDELGAADADVGPTGHEDANDDPPAGAAATRSQARGEPPPSTTASSIRIEAPPETAIAVWKCPAMSPRLATVTSRSSVRSAPENERLAERWLPRLSGDPRGGRAGAGDRHVGLHRQRRLARARSSRARAGSRTAWSATRR